MVDWPLRVSLLRLPGHELRLHRSNWPFLWPWWALFGCQEVVSLQRWLDFFKLFRWTTVRDSLHARDFERAALAFVLFSWTCHLLRLHWSLEQCMLYLCLRECLFLMLLGTWWQTLVGHHGTIHVFDRGWATRGIIILFFLGVYTLSALLDWSLACCCLKSLM